MSKLFSGKRYFLKQIKQPNENDTYTNQSMQDIIDSYSKNSPGISNNFSSFNKNNVTLEYQKHYSPSFRSPVSLPPISGKNRRTNNSQKKPATKKLVNSNSSTNLYSKSLFAPTSKKNFEREKTQVDINEKNFEQDKNISELDLDNINNGNNLNNNITQINNITNINIHIYRGNEIDDNNNENKDEIIQKSNSLLNGTNNINNYNSKNAYYKVKQNKINSGSSSLIGNSGMSIINSNSNKKASTYSKSDKKKGVKGNLIIMPPNTTSNNNNNKSINSTLSTIGSMIINNSGKGPSSKGLSQKKGGNHNKFFTNSLPDISMGRSNSTKKKKNSIDYDIMNILKDENNNNMNSKDLENIDISMNFLKDLSTNNSSFVAFLELIQCHMDIEILLNVTENSGNSLFRKKVANTINNDKILKLSNLLNNYFNILSKIYIKNNNVLNNNNQNKVEPIDNFFLYQPLDYIFQKCIKIQICLFCSFLVTLSQLGLYDINVMIRNHFHQIIKEISNPLLNIFETFIKEEINLNHPELITINLRPDFNENYNKLYKIQKYTFNYKNSELISLIAKNLEKCVNSMKYYSSLNLKYSAIKPFGDALNQLLYSLDRKTLNQFATITLKTILFGELDITKAKSMKIGLGNNNNVMQTGSSIKNNIKDFAPFLPAINPKYKYTLVLDMDETLIHYFFTNISGMFFVRPYCFEFLKELNELYEIVTFTAGTKDYADGILNLLDIDNNIIKYRLYRHHITMLGCSIYKDLSKLGRDLSKVIIVDNLKENFRLQPNNGIFIKTWTNDINDVQLKDLLKILKDIVNLNINDVRFIIQKMNDEIKISRNIIRPYANINISKYVS